MAGFAVVSLACLLLYWPALHDIWDAQGRPDYWRGEGAAALEWQVVSLLYWPMLLLHLLVLGRTVGVLRATRRKKRQPTIRPT